MTPITPTVERWCGSRGAATAYISELVCRPLSSSRRVRAPPALHRCAFEQLCTNRWQAPRTCRDAVEMHRVPLHYTPKDCVQAAESWLRSCKDPLKRSPETPLHHGSEPCPGRAAGSVSAPAGHLTPVLTTPDLVPGLGTVTTVCHVHVRHPGPGPGRLPTEWEVLRKRVKKE